MAHKKGTNVESCVKQVTKSKGKGAAIAICQDSTKQDYKSGKKEGKKKDKK